MKAITIQGYEFTAPEPYSAGHVLTDGEAGALNQTFAENLRNNYAATVKAAKDDHGDKLPPGIVESLRDDFEAYAKEYKFGVRRVGEVDPVRVIKNKAASLTDDQKRAIVEAMGLEYKPSKKAA